MTKNEGRPGQDGQNTQQIDFLMAEAFLQALDPLGAFTFQTFGDSEKDPALVRTFSGTFTQHRDTLARLNREGAGVFITVARTDGQGRKKENVTGVRAVFADFDGAPLPDEWPLEPHLIIESSPERWHVYWLVAPGFPLDLFEPVQKAISARFGSDPAVCDLPRVMRLPGFIHRKGEPFLTRIARDWSNEPRYLPDDILRAFPGISEGRKAPTPPTDDLVIQKLTEKGMVIHQDRQEKGKFVIRCPWADRHTNGDAEAAYWLPNHGGFKGAGFKCLHGHCSGRTAKDLLEWLGIRKEAKSPEIITRRLSEVQSKPVEWLWPGYLPSGALCLIDGDPCNGKSFLTQNLAAKTSSGGTFPTGERATPGGVVLLSYEDDAGFTIRPRLETMGGDLDRIILLEGLKDEKGSRLIHVGDIGAIRAAVEDIQARLVIVDPLMAALPGAIDSHSDQNIRSILAPLSKLAHQTGVTVLVVRHLNKSGGGNALYRGGGSIGIVAAARAAFLVAKDPEDEGRRVLAVTKMNIAPEPKSLAYRIAVNAEGSPFLSWEGETDLTARDLLAPEEKPRNAPKRGLAKQFLNDVLKDGPVDQRTIEREAESRDISPETLKRAKKDLGIRSKKVGQSGPWVWEMEDDSKGVTVPIRNLGDTLPKNGGNSGRLEEGQPPKTEPSLSPDTLRETVENQGSLGRGSSDREAEVIPFKKVEWEEVD